MGLCNGCEVEILGVFGLVYDVEWFGVWLVVLF